MLRQVRRDIPHGKSRRLRRLQRRYLPLSRTMADEPGHQDIRICLRPVLQYPRGLVESRLTGDAPTCLLLVAAVSCGTYPSRSRPKAWSRTENIRWRVLLAERGNKKSLPLKSPHQLSGATASTSRSRSKRKTAVRFAVKTCPSERPARTNANTQERSHLILSPRI
jgi:hypothetical protein